MRWYLLVFFNKFIYSEFLNCPQLKASIFEIFVSQYGNLLWVLSFFFMLCLGHVFFTSIADMPALCKQ